MHFPLIHHKRYEPSGYIWRQHLVRGISAAIIDEIKVLHTLLQIVLQPLTQDGVLILELRARCQKEAGLHCGICMALSGSLGACSELAG